MTTMTAGADGVGVLQRVRSKKPIESGGWVGLVVASRCRVPRRRMHRPLFKVLELGGDNCFHSVQYLFVTTHKTLPRLVALFDLLEAGHCLLFRTRTRHSFLPVWCLNFQFHLGFKQVDLHLEPFLLLHPWRGTSDLLRTGRWHGHKARRSTPIKRVFKQVRQGQ